MIEKYYKTSLGNIHYLISKKIDKKLPFLIFLPGLTADHRLFDKQIEYFESICNCLVWDAPGHYKSYPFDLNFDLKDKARWLDEILTSEGINEPIIVGQSMGGYVGQMYSELYPDKLKGFVVIDSAPLQRKYMTSIEIWLLKHTEGMYRAYPWNLLIKQGASGCAESIYGRDLMTKMMKEYDKDQYVKLVSSGYKMLAKAIEADLPYEIKCPLLLICGEKDKAGSAKTYNKKWEKETGNRVHWILDAGHNSNTDKPDEINNLIKEFISKI